MGQNRTNEQFAIPSFRIEGCEGTLSPGVYCNGLKISGSSQVRFDPGVYIITGKNFLVQDKAHLTGDGAGFYLADDETTFEFTKGTTIELSAPTEGAFAGILFFDSRAVSQGRMHRISSNNAKNLIGTFFLPKAKLLIDAEKPIAAEPAFTVIVAESIELLKNPNVVLNANYAQTDVPVPSGLTGDCIVLTE